MGVASIVLFFGRPLPLFSPVEVEAWIVSYVIMLQEEYAYVSYLALVTLLWLYTRSRATGSFGRSIGVDTGDSGLALGRHLAMSIDDTVTRS